MHDCTHIGQIIITSRNKIGCTKSEFVIHYIAKDILSVFEDYNELNLLSDLLFRTVKLMQQIAAN